jgi:hypothetical protein
VRGVKNLIKKYLGKCFSSPRRLRGVKVPNVDPSHLICEMQIKRWLFETEEKWVDKVILFPPLISSNLHRWMKRLFTFPHEVD